MSDTTRTARQATAGPRDLTAALAAVGAELGHTIGAACQDALASGRPDHAALALDALIGAGQDLLVDGYRVGHREDLDTVVAALNRQMTRR